MTNPVLTEFECPICIEYMMPPIHQCTMGHIFCLSCFNRFTKCPTCRSPKGVSRAYAFERIHSSVLFPCRFKSEGCELQIKGAELKEHQETCIFAKNNCPLSHVMSCKWTGPKMGIVAHCTQEHPANTHTGNHVILKCPLFDLLEGVTAYYFIILQSHSQEFLFCWHIDANGIMQWVLYFLGSPKDRKRFRYTLFIGNPYGDHDPIVMTTGCEQKVEQYDMFSRQHCLTSSYDMVKKRCNKNGDLHYEIKITDKI